MKVILTTAHLDSMCTLLSNLFTISITGFYIIMTITVTVRSATFAVNGLIIYCITGIRNSLFAKLIFLRYVNIVS